METSSDYQSNMEDTMATLGAMCSQEEQAYLTHSYLHEPATLPVPNALLDHVDIECRTKMTAWCYQVIDFCKFDRETVSIAMNYLDRYLASETGSAALLDRKVFQLAAMTCLYTAVKIHEPEAMTPELVSNLSRGAYSSEEIERMEASILAALQWRLNPPTSLAFARTFMKLIPDIDSSIHDMIYDLVRLQTELAVGDCSFINAPASTIGFCSLIHALESLGMDNKMLANICYLLSQATGINLSDHSVVFVQECLYKAVEHAEDPKLAAVQRPTTSPKKSRRFSVDVSPRSVSAIR